MQNVNAPAGLSAPAMRYTGRTLLRVPHHHFRRTGVPPQPLPTPLAHATMPAAGFFHA